MKKLIIAALLLIIGAVCASPFLIGSKVESIAQQQAEQTDQQLKQLVHTNPYISEASFKLQSYEKSFANAKASSLLSLTTAITDENDEPVVFEIPVTSDISHGPYLGDKGFGLANIESRPDLSKLDLPEAIKADTLTLNNTISFSGSNNSTLLVKPIKYQPEDDVTIDFGGAKGQLNQPANNPLTFDGDIAINDLIITFMSAPMQLHVKPFDLTLKGNGDSKTMTGDYDIKSSPIKAEGKLEDQTYALTIQQLLADGNYKKIPDTDMYLGKNTVKVSQVDITSSALPETIKLPELIIKGHIEQNDNKHIDISGQYLAQLDSSIMKLLQSPVDVKKIDLAVQVNNIPMSALQLNQELAEQFSDTNAKLSDEDSEALINKLKGIMKEVVQNASDMQLDLQADTEHGALKSELDFGIQKDKPLSDADLQQIFDAESNDTGKLLALFEGKGYATLDKAVVENDKSQMLGLFIMMGGKYLTMQDDVFKSDILFKDSQLTVNGNPIPLFKPAAMPEEEEEEAMDSEEDDIDMTEVEEADAEIVDPEDTEAEDTEAVAEE